MIIYLVYCHRKSKMNLTIYKIILPGKMSFFFFFLSVYKLTHVKAQYSTQRVPIIMELTLHSACMT